MKMVKLTRVLASTAALAVVTAASARADFRDFRGMCSTGALRTCASMQVFTTINGSGGTDVTILVRNLEGSPGLGINTGGSIITRIGLVAPVGIGSASGLSVTAIGGATTTGAAGAQWHLATPGGLGGLIELTAGTASGTNIDGGITGCAMPGGPAPATYFTTCGNSSGWVSITFSTSNPWFASNAEVAFLQSNFATPVGGVNGLECDSAQNSAGRAYCPVTPEPVSMLLMASGLTGMGGFGFLRRRRGQDTPKV